MTPNEAKQIAAIIETADGGCESCVKDLCFQLTKAFPFVWKVAPDFYKAATGERVTVTPK